MTAWPWDISVSRCRNKRSAEADLREPQIRDRMLELAADADVVVENFRPGVMARLGLGYDDIRAVNSRIIYASSTDPDMGLGEVLLRGGEIDLHQYNTAMDRIVVARRIGTTLVELGYLDADQLIRAVEHQASTIVLNAMAYRSGNYTIEFSP